MSTSQRFILMPASHTQASDNDNPLVKDFLIRLNTNVESASSGAMRLNTRNAPRTTPSSIKLKVVDSINDDGAKLVEMQTDELADFRFSYPGLRIIPEKFYRRPPLPIEPLLFKTQKAQAMLSVQITITDEQGKPVPDAYVVAFTNFTKREGGGGTTGKTGKLKLSLKTSKVQRLYVYPQHSYWGYYKASFTMASSMSIKLVSISTSYTDSLRYFYPTQQWPDITIPIKVAVIDSGVGPHKDLHVVGGANTIDGEKDTDYEDNGDGEGHGTHVGGIIAANGGIKGVAAGVQLYSYRVFPKNGNASNFYIMKAIMKAVADGCLLINMSLGEAGLDEGVVSYIKDAYSKGVICFAANGNDGRQPVSFPASYSLCVAVGALGRKDNFPSNTVQKSTVKTPYGTDAKNYAADFSNIGPETDLVAPGVGVISTYPGGPQNLYTVMDGTSMACPAATGMAARLLSSRPDLVNMAPTQQRADEILKFLSTHVKPMGLGANFEGKGMLML